MLAPEAGRIYDTSDHVAQTESGGAVQGATRNEMLSFEVKQSTTWDDALFFEKVQLVQQFL